MQCLVMQSPLLPRPVTLSFLWSGLKVSEGCTSGSVYIRCSGHPLAPELLCTDWASLCSQDLSHTLTLGLLGSLPKFWLNTSKLRPWKAPEARKNGQLTALKLGHTNLNGAGNLCLSFGSFCPFLFLSQNYNISRKQCRKTQIYVCVFRESAEEFRFLCS